MADSTGFQIVRATRDQLEQVAPLFDAYRTFYGYPSDLPLARAFLRDRLERNESVIFLALSSQPDSEAFGFTQLYPSFSSGNARRIWILNDLFVAPTVRRSGVGRALMDAARVFATADGAAYLELQTATDNFNAQRLYESVGYVRDTHYYTYTLQLDPHDPQ
jgi:ribosomal protein S18 acetylase RimI-like enzyme